MGRKLGRFTPAADMGSEINFGSHRKGTTLSGSGMARTRVSTL
jgi:hypothetical protein